MPKFLIGFFSEKLWKITVLRIRTGCRIQIFFHPRSNKDKKQEGKNIFVLPLFVAINLATLEIIIYI
jgi:hypothetical protein